MTSYLRLVAEISGHAERIAPVLESALERSGATRILDLGSGGGGATVPAFRVLFRSRHDLRLTLSDLHPNLHAFDDVKRSHPDTISVMESPIDATHVPNSAHGVRTLMNVFHHFSPTQAQAVLQNAVDARQAIVVVEMLRRHPAVFAASLFSFVPVFLSVPFLRPFRWSWLFWTYVLPAVPLATVWDGAVSALRVYSKCELLDLVHSVDGHDTYDWEIGEVQLAPSPVPGSYLVGTLKRPPSAPDPGGAENQV
jgi:hypothetical protein